MRDFLTEKETEAYLIYETRDIPLGNGHTEVVTASNLFWTRLDLILDANITNMDELIRLTRLNMQGTGYSFSQAFQSVVTCVDQRAA